MDDIFNIRDVHFGMDRSMDRATRMCEVMITALENSEEYGEDVKAVLLVECDHAEKSDRSSAGMVLHNIEDMDEVAFVLMRHLKVVVESMGKEIHIIPVNRG